MKLAIILPYFNPLRLKSFEANLKICVDHLLRFVPIDQIFIAEVLYTDSRFNDEPVYPKLPAGIHPLFFYTRDLLFYKEQILNVAGRIVCQGGYDGVVTLDADAIFDDPDWLLKIAEALKEHDVVQCFSTIDLHYDLEAQTGTKTMPSAVKYLMRCKDLDEVNAVKVYAAPGASWAYRKKVAESCGMFGMHVLGGGDGAFLSALMRPVFGFDVWKLRTPLHESYQALLDEYALELIKVCDSVGYVDTHMRLLAHGTEAGRQYTSRQELVKSVNFKTDFVKNFWGLSEWKDPSRPEREKVIWYFQSRDDDAQFTHIA